MQKYLYKINMRYINSQIVMGKTQNTYQHSSRAKLDTNIGAKSTLLVSTITEIISTKTTVVNDRNYDPVSMGKCGYERIGSGRVPCRLSRWRDPFLWTDPLLSGPA